MAIKFTKGGFQSVPDLPPQFQKKKIAAKQPPPPPPVDEGIIEAQQDLRTREKLRAAGMTLREAEMAISKQVEPGAAAVGLARGKAAVEATYQKEKWGYPTETTGTTQTIPTGKPGVAGVIGNLAFGNILETNPYTGQPNIDVSTGQPVKSELNIFPGLAIAGSAGVATGITALTGKLKLSSVAGLYGGYKLIARQTSDAESILADSMTEMDKLIAAVKAGGSFSEADAVFNELEGNIYGAEGSIKWITHNDILSFIIGGKSTLTKFEYARRFDILRLRRELIDAHNIALRAEISARLGVPV